MQKQMSLLNYPTELCVMCKGDTWWYQEVGGWHDWVCGVCHPPATELATLKMRVRKGNYVLNQSRLAIMRLPEAEKQRSLITWTAAVQKLKALAEDLKRLDKACLYIENHEKLKKCQALFDCFGCPNDYWFERELGNDLR